MAVFSKLVRPRELLLLSAKLDMLPSASLPPGCPTPGVLLWKRVGPIRAVQWKKFAEARQPRRAKMLLSGWKFAMTVNGLMLVVVQITNTC